MLRVALLGAVEAHRDGVRAEVPAGRTTDLLARLALDADAPVGVDALLEDIWGEPTARNTLQSKVSQLRRALGPAPVRGGGTSSRLAMPPDDVQAVRAERPGARSAAASAVGHATASLDA